MNVELKMKVNVVKLLLRCAMSEELMKLKKGGIFVGFISFLFTTGRPPSLAYRCSMSYPSDLDFAICVSETVT